ncbi:MAG TPA: VOC family protein [Ornithinicoccus sp.]|nr:VOC family protein [Ornithinicoccus sp.]
MALRWYSTVVDCKDVHAQAEWWADVLDWQLIYETHDEAAIVPRWMTAEKPSAEEWHTVPPGLVFVPVEEGKQVKNRLHIDLAPHLTDNRDAIVQGLIAKGARLVDVGQDPDKATWTVLADPEGNEFCVLSARDL